MLEKLAGRGIAKGDILHTAESLFHDHGPANDFGLANCWIHRRHEAGGFGATMNPGKTPKTDFRFTSMAEMAEAHRAALAGGA
jgi:FMN phosphatase YigB (HAD superfamily)